MVQLNARRNIHRYHLCVDSRSCRRRCVAVSAAMEAMKQDGNNFLLPVAATHRYRHYQVSLSPFIVILFLTDCSNDERPQALTIAET